MAAGRLSNATGIGGLPGPNHYCCLTNLGRQKSLHLLYGHREVSIAKEAIFSGSRQHAVFHRPALAPMGQSQKLKLGPAIG
jgi:hypothetical protein